METTENMEYKIIEKAKQLFVEKGFEDTNMSDIAIAVGINRTTLHYYFRTKDIMFQAVLGLLVQSFIPRIQTIIDQDSTFMQKLDQILNEYISLFEANPSLPKFMLGEVQRDVNHLLAVAQKEVDKDIISLMKNQLIKEMKEGKLKQVPIVEVISTFYSLLIFPFLAKNLITKLFFNGEQETYLFFLKRWKKNILQQMKALLERQII